MFNFNWEQISSTVGSIGTAAEQINSVIKKNTSKKSDSTPLILLGLAAALFLKK
jgi:hypothetical protein